MKKLDIITLVNCGVLNMTAHNLKPAHAYKAFKLKREIEKAFNDIQEEQKSIREENGVTEELDNKIQKIIDKINIKIKVSEDERQEMLAYNEKTRRVTSLLEKAAEGDVNIDVKTIPYEDWRQLQDENRDKEINGRHYDVLGGKAEIILEGIFWEEPKDETNN